MMFTNRGLFHALSAVAVGLLAYQYYINGRTSATPYVIVNVAGKGKGLVATRNIMQGELILKEVPLFVVQTSSDANLNVHLKKVLSSLNASQRETYYNLSKPASSGDPDVTELVFRVNSVAVGDGSAGVFPTIARVNHGCARSFNSVYHWKAEEGVGVLHALKPIKKGDEILREYLNTKSPKSQRREALKQIYSFDCTCSVCSQSSRDSERSDATLKSMATIEAEFRKWKEEKDVDGAEAVRLAKRVWTLGEKEGYVVGRGRLAEEVTEIAAAHHDEKSARLWADLAAEWYSYELGYDSIEAARVRLISSDPTKHPAWGTREELLVGGPDMITI